MKQFDQHSENIEKEGATAFLKFIKEKVEPLAWTSALIDSIETDSKKFVRGDYDEAIKAELNAPGFAEISISIRERQTLEAAAMFIRRELARLAKVGRKKKWKNAKEKNDFFNAKRKARREENK